MPTYRFLRIGLFCTLLFAAAAGIARADCDFPTITIDDGALVMYGYQATLTLCAAGATEMMISNDGGFLDAFWEPYATTKSWTVARGRDEVDADAIVAVLKDDFASEVSASHREGVPLGARKK